MNGMTTLAENIADNNGLDIAYKAYKTFVSHSADREKPLPGLNMTMDQLFFLSFTQVNLASRG